MSACLVAAIAVLLFIPVMLRARVENHRLACQANLRMLVQAKINWAEMYQVIDPSVVPPFEQVGRMADSEFPPICTAGGEYSMNRLDENPSCSLPEHTFPTSQVLRP